MKYKESSKLKPFLTFSKVLMGIVIIFFVFTRLHNITQVPPSLYWDEASIAYNAYSISKNLTDEWGELLPLHFRAFGEFKLPVYIYSTSILTSLFGMHEWVVRLPAVLYSLGSVILVYFLAKSISKNNTVGLLSAALLAVSPWFFIFSRTGYEATAGLFFYLLSITFLLHSTKHKLLIVISAFCVILSIYSYNSYRVLGLLTYPLLFFWIYLGKGFKSRLVLFVISVLIIGISLIPIIRLILYDGGFSRAESFSLIPHVQQVYDLEGVPKYQIIYDRANAPEWSKNAGIVFKNYLSHLSLEFLFIKGDLNPRSHSPGTGQQYIFEFIFLILGLYYILIKRNKEFWIPVVIVLLSFIPPSLFKEAPHSLRAMSAAPFLTIIIAFGINKLYKVWGKSQIFFVAILTVYLISFGIQYSYFLNGYRESYSSEWQYAYKRLFLDYKDKFETKEKVIITDEFGQPYIFALIYLNMNPSSYLETVEYNPVNNWGFSTVKSFNKFEFHKPTEEDFTEGNLVFTTVRIPKLKESLINEIQFLNGETALLVYEL